LLLAATAASSRSGPRAEAGAGPGWTWFVTRVLVATALVAVLPVAAAWILSVVGLIDALESFGLAVVLSLAASVAGAALWRRHGRGDVVFGDLLPWGWLRRRRAQRELANATALLLASLDAHGVELEQRGEFIERMADALEAQDAYVTGHSRRVARHATRIARELGLSNAEAAKVRLAAAIHDVGKLAVPSSILNKPGTLTEREFAVIKRHADEGARIVSVLGDPELTAIVRHHHERMDGNGYPAGLVGEEIPLGARIIAVADTFDAVTSARPYRGPAAHKEAIAILGRASGPQVDPRAVRAFLRSYSGARRPLVIWAVLTSMPLSALASLTGQPVSAAGQALAVAAAAGVLGGAAALPNDSHRPVEHAAPGVHRASGFQTDRAAPGIRVAAAVRQPARRVRASRLRRAVAGRRVHRASPPSQSPAAGIPFLAPIPIPTISASPPSPTRPGPSKAPPRHRGAVRRHHGSRPARPPSRTHQPARHAAGVNRPKPARQATPSTSSNGQGAAGHRAAPAGASGHAH
jgi:putative nucleotidyltransferase with HDIG domain